VHTTGDEKGEKEGFIFILSRTDEPERFEDNQV
jgi:hypothetical protein